MYRTIAASVTLFTIVAAPPAIAMNKAELVDAIAAETTLTKSDARRALDAFINASSKKTKKGDKISLVGFGSFSISKGAVSPPGGPGTAPDGKALKPLKVSYRGAGPSAGTLSVGPEGTWEFVLGLPSAAFVDDTLQAEVTFPSSFGTRELELEVGLPSLADGTTLRAMVDSLGADEGLVLEVSLASDFFDDFVYDPMSPDPDYLGALYTSFHTDGSGVPCADALLSERLGFGGASLCAAAPCALSPNERDALLSTIAADSELSLAAAGAALDAILSLPYAPPLTDAGSLSGMGSYSVSKREARTGRNPQTGKAIKIAAKKVAKFKAGADLSK